MKTPLFLGAFATLSLVAFVSPLAAANKKPAPQRQALVAAVQAVSPDALGGKLGLGLAAENPPVAQVAAAPRTSPRLASSQSGKSADNLAYRSWKTSKSS